MSADYSRNRYGGSRRRRGGPCGFWFVAGVLVGLFGAGLAWLKLGPDFAGIPGLIPGAPEAGRTADKVGGSTDSQIPKPRFDFYNILPEMEVVIPEEEIAGDRRPLTSSPAQPEAESRRQEAVLLQVGSFRNSADAEKLKAQLALLGIEAWIQRVSIDNKHSFHRVRSGPYLDYRRLDEVREQLKRNKLSSIVIKLKE